MQLISFGNFYLGIDKESFTDVLVHIGRVRLEWDCSPQTNGSPTSDSYQSTDGESSEADEPAASP